MQQLHLVGFTTDSDHLILSAKKGAKSGSFLVPLDERLLEVIADAVRRRGQDEDSSPLPQLAAELLPTREASKRSSNLSPRELQARLRAGRTVAQVAKEAGADEDWVAKFEPPVLAERARVISRARELLYAKPRRGESAEPLGMAVRWNLADRGIRLTDGEFDSCWSAFYIGDSTWGITFTFTSRARPQEAEWEVDFDERDVVARNRLASDLGYAEPGRRRRLAALVPDAGEAAARARGASDEQAPAAKKSPGKKATAKKSAAKKAAAKKAAAKKSVGKKSIVKRSPAPAARRNATAKKKAARQPRKAAQRARAGRTTTAVKKGRTTRAAKTAKSSRSSRSAKRPPERPTIARVSASPEAGAANAPSLLPSAGNELSRRRLELVGKQVPAARPARPRPVDTYAPQPEPPRPRAERTEARAADEPVTPEVASEVAGDGESAAQAEARARREARRAARAERVARAAPSESLPRPASALLDDSVIPTDEGRVVTIRAPRAVGDVVVPGGPKPLRPALPAAQPKRRRFARNR